MFEQVKAGYFQLAYIQKTLAVLGRDQTLLDQIEKIAEAHYRLGQGNQQDVLKAQLQKTKILNDLAHHHELMGSQQAQMSKTSESGAGRRRNVEADDLTETPLTFTSEELLAKVRTENPDVTGGQEMVRKQSLQVEIARKDRYPDFNVQYEWEHTGGAVPRLLHADVQRAIADLPQAQARSRDDAGRRGTQSIAPRV